MIRSRPDGRSPLVPAWLSNAADIGWRVLVVFALIVVVDLAVILRANRLVVPCRS